MAIRAPLLFVSHPTYASMLLRTRLNIVSMNTFPHPRPRRPQVVSTEHTRSPGCTLFFASLVPYLSLSLKKTRERTRKEEEREHGIAAPLVVKKPLRSIHLMGRTRQGKGEMQDPLQFPFTHIPVPSPSTPHEFP